jgi:hypothetical protein
MVLFCPWNDGSRTIACKIAVYTNITASRIKTHSLYDGA